MPADADVQVVAVLGRVDAGLNQARERLFDLLRTPSISTQPEHEPDIQRAAEWLRDQLAGLGFKVAIKPTATTIERRARTSVPGQHRPADVRSR
jgi:acetylornithine deacetylase/succinyl-diaminopimelate desuccinylase-like protein